MSRTLGVEETRRRLSKILSGFTRPTSREAVVVGSYHHTQGVLISVEEYEDLVSAREERARAALEAVASVRVEGGKPTRAFLGDLGEAISGDLSDRDLIERTVARHRVV